MTAVVYRVHSDNEEAFKNQIANHHLINATILVSPGAADDYNLYINKNVAVYFIKSEETNLLKLEETLRTSPPTSTSFKKLGAFEFFI